MAPALLQAATFALRAAASICPASPACPRDDQCISTANGVSIQVSCATDYFGGDLQLAQASTLAACMKACSTTTSCVAASYVSGNCYIKSQINAASENANVIGIAVTSRETTTTTPQPTAGQTCPASITCPESDSCSYIIDSRTLTVSCGVDYYGGDIDSMSTGSLEACTLACATNSQCIAASFVGGKGAGQCYLKGTKAGASFNDNVDAFYMGTAISTSSATTSPSASVASSSATSSSVASSSASSSAITSSSSTSTPSPSTSSTLLSSTVSSSSSASSSSPSASSTPLFSTVVSSTSTSSRPTPTPLSPGTCDSINSSANLIQNPSFELITSAGNTDIATGWTASTTSISFVKYAAAAHCGIAYMVISNNGQNPPSTASQKITTALDTSRSYAASFFLNPLAGNQSVGSCTLELYANDQRIFSRALTSFTPRVYWEWHASTSFTPSSSDVTLKVQYQCTGSFSSNILIDDISLVPV